MRIKATIIVAVVVGIVLCVHLLVGNRTLSSLELRDIKDNCVSCHSNVPAYSAAIIVHDKHAAFNCSLCHSDNNVAKAADNIHVGLRWLNVGLTISALTAISTSLLLINRKKKVN